MSKKDIIDYVMETPGNTNKKVLGRLIDEVEGVKLPEVTTDDNGDVLTVVEGAWDKAVPSGGGVVAYPLDFYDDEGNLLESLDPTQIEAINNNIDNVHLIAFKDEGGGTVQAWIQFGYSFVDDADYLFVSNQLGYESVGSGFILYAFTVDFRVNDIITLSFGDSNGTQSYDWLYDKNDGSWNLFHNEGD